MDRLGSTVDGLEHAKLVVRNARRLLSDPKRWSSSDDGYAFNAAGEEVHPLSQDAVSFCLMSAFDRAAGFSIFFKEYPATPFIMAALRAEGMEDDTCLIDMNDDPATTHADVLAFLDSIVERLHQSSTRAVGRVGERSVLGKAAT